jgi:hypothetical protein
MDKNALLATRAGVEIEEVEIPGVGTVKVRGLSRFELLVGQKKHEGDNLKQERWVLSLAMVDPVLTEDEVATWQRTSPPMEIERVAQVVNRLSGIGKDAAKSDVPGDGDD